MTRQLQFVSAQLARDAICHGRPTRDCPPLSAFEAWTPAQRSLAHQWVLDCWPVGRAPGWSAPAAPDFVAELLAKHKCTIEPIRFGGARWEDDDVDAREILEDDNERLYGQSWGTVDRPEKGRTP